MGRSSRLAAALALVVGLVGAGTVATGEEPIPEFYGIYAVSGGTLAELRNYRSEMIMQIEGVKAPTATPENRVRFFCFTPPMANMGAGRVGLAEISERKLASDAYFLAYGPDWRNKVSGFALYRLSFVPRLSVTVITVGYQKITVSPNLWLAREGQSLRVGAVRGQQDLYKLVPAAPLQSGAYALARGPVGEDVSWLDVQAGAVAFLTDFYVGEKPAQPASGGALSAPSRVTSSSTTLLSKATLLEVAWTPECDPIAAESPAKDDEMKAVCKADERLAARDMGFKAFLAYGKNKDLGTKAYKEKDYKGAAGFFEEVLRVRPDEWYAHYKLAAAYAAGDNPDGALAHACFALRRLRDKWLYVVVAQAFSKKGEKQACLRWLDPVLGAGLGLSKAQLDEIFPPLAQDQDYQQLLAKHSIAGK